MRTSDLFLPFLLLGTAIASLRALPMDPVKESFPERESSLLEDAGATAEVRASKGRRSVDAASDTTQRATYSNIPISEVDSITTTATRVGEQQGDEEGPINLTLEDFRKTLAEHPDAARFVIAKDGLQGASLQVLEAGGDAIENSNENKNVINALQMAVAGFLGMDVDGLLQKNRETSTEEASPLSADRLRLVLETLDKSQDSSSISAAEFNSADNKNRENTSSCEMMNRPVKRVRNVGWRPALGLAALLSASSALCGRSEMMPACPSWNDSSFIKSMPETWHMDSLLYSHINWTTFSAITTVRDTCHEAERAYKLAAHAATEASNACFENLDHPNNEQEKLWEKAFLNVVPFKAKWIIAERTCQEALNLVRDSQRKMNSLIELATSLENRKLDWLDAAIWHPSSYSETFSKDLHEYSHACVVDSEESDGPALGQKTRKIVVRAPYEFPYTCLESILNTSTNALLYQSEIVADHLIVELNKGEDPNAFLKKLEHLNVDTSIERNDPYDETVYRLSFKKVSLKIMSKVLEKSRHFAVRSNYNSLGRSTIHSNAATLTHPNDVNYSDQLSLQRISAPRAWNIQTSAPSVIAAVIDSGMHPHEDLDQNMWNNSKASQYYKPHEYQHGFTADSALDIIPHDNHGTHCGGIIGAIGNNNCGIAGIAWKTKLMFCKATKMRNQIDWPDDHLRNCINHVWHNNASVINLSFRDLKDRPETFRALTAARNNNVIVVTAAGNDNRNIDAHPPIYPASYAKSYKNPNGLDNMIVVAATDNHDQLANFSNYGPNSVHLAAPGCDILSTMKNYVSNTSGYEKKSGTSMAVPHVAGALALMIQQFPNKNYTWLIERLLNTTDRIPSLVNKTMYRRLNLARALESENPANNTCPANP